MPHAIQYAFVVQINQLNSVRRIIKWPILKVNIKILSFLFPFYRLSSLILFCALIEFRYFSVRTSNGLIVESDLNRALYGHSFLNISRITMQDCLERCLANCLCLSFQLCGNTLVSCQLCSSNKYLKPTEIRESKSCTSFNFENPNKVN